MGAFEAGTFNQLKKGQGETNDRLDALLVELKRTNELLGWVCNAIHEQAKASGANDE